MGMFKSPKVAKDPELEKQRAEQARINAENTAQQEADASERKRKVSQNLIGQKSLQDDDMNDFTGYRRKMMGNNKDA